MRISDGNKFRALMQVSIPIGLARPRYKHGNLHLLGNLVAAYPQN